MKKPKKLFTAIAAIAAALIMPLSAFAESAEAKEEMPDFNQEAIAEAVPSDAQDFLEKNDITPDNQGVLSLSPIDFLGEIWEIFRANITRPLRLFLSISGVILLCAFTESFRESAGSSRMTEAFTVVSVLAAAGMLVADIGDCIVQITSVLGSAAQFMTVFIPSFAAIMAVSGRLTTASLFNASVLAASQIFSQVAVNVLLPLSSSILGLSIAGTINSDIKIESAARFVKNVVVWVLGLIMTVFTGLLTVQSFVTAASDGVVMRTAKFAVSSAIPIVGGSISEALNTVQGTLSLVKNSIGSFGIIAGIMIILPVFMTVLGYKLALIAAGAVSELFSTSAITSLIKSAEIIMTIAIAVMSCFLMMTVIAIGLMLVLGLGA